MTTRQKRPLSPADTKEEKEKAEEEPRIYHAPRPIHDRNSTFKAIFSSSQTHLSNPKSLQSHPDFHDAMHKMLAYRRKSSQKALTFSSSSSSSTSSQSSSALGNASASTKYVTFSDEDGEKYAGRKLEKVLEDMGVEGVVVVARWYGGVLLGPVRFEHIVGVARDAIVASRGSDTSMRPEQGSKRVRVGDNNNVVVDELKERERLIRVLGERDASVGVLRSLLAEKTDALGKLLVVNAADDDDDDVDNANDDNGKDGGGLLVSASQQSFTNPAVSPSKPPGGGGGLDYVSMSLVKLKQMEKARDATLAWILKQIDGVEIKIKDEEKKLDQKVPSTKLNDENDGKSQDDLD